LFPAVPKGRISPSEYDFERLVGVVLVAAAATTAFTCSTLTRMRGIAARCSVVVGAVVSSVPGIVVCLVALSTHYLRHAALGLVMGGLVPAFLLLADRIAGCEKPSRTDDAGPQTPVG